MEGAFETRGPMFLVVPGQSSELLPAAAAPERQASESATHQPAGEFSRRCRT